MSHDFERLEIKDCGWNRSRHQRARPDILYKHPLRRSSTDTRRPALQRPTAKPKDVDSEFTGAPWRKQASECLPRGFTTLESAILTVAR